MYKYVIKKLLFMTFYINICHKITMHIILYVIIKLKKTFYVMNYIQL